MWPKEGENKVPEGFKRLSLESKGNRVCGRAVGTGSTGNFPNWGLLEMQQWFGVMATAWKAAGAAPGYGGPLLCPLVAPLVLGISGCGDVSSSLCCVESPSQCLVASLQSPWMAEAELRWFSCQAGLFSCSFQQMLPRGTLEPLPSGCRACPAPGGIILPGVWHCCWIQQFGFSLESFWTSLNCWAGLCSVLTPRQSSSKLQERAHGKTRWNSCFGSVRTPGPNIPGGIEWPRGSPGCVRALQGRSSGRCPSVQELFLRPGSGQALSVPRAVPRALSQWIGWRNSITGMQWECW